jgi:hypothetical protein
MLQNHLYDIFANYNMKMPVVAVEWAAFLLFIWEIKNLNLDPEAGYPDWDIFVFLPPPPLVPPREVLGLYLSLDPWRFVAHPFPFIYYSTL